MRFSVEGIGASPEMPTTWGVVLRIEFVPINGVSGDATNPSRDVYFKILPKGSSSIPGILLGHPLLDCEPYGFGWERKERPHYFTALKVHLLRGEIPHRKDHVEAVKRWHMDAGDTYVNGSQASGDRDCLMSERSPKECSPSSACLKKREAELAGSIRAIYDGPEITVEPGEGASLARSAHVVTDDLPVWEPWTPCM